MSGWLNDLTGYSVVMALEYQAALTAAGTQFDAAMRAGNGQNAYTHLHLAKSHLRKAIRALETIQYDVTRGNSP
jgi:hypothetical protein